MGQRHQIFIKINNPYKNDRLFDGKDKVKAGKIFGRGKHTVIALHHQWLYGRSALLMAAHILNITNPETMSEYSSPFGHSFYCHTANGKSELENYIDRLMMMLQVITNPKFPRGTGIERMHFLNDSDWGECEGNDMRKNFMAGDNNDGITIIDSVKRKYCFMNIHDFDYGDDDPDGIYSLPLLEPVTAIDYATAYYPDKDDAEGNAEAAGFLAEYEVLNKKEIAKIFPEMKDKLFRV